MKELSKTYKQFLRKGLAAEEPSPTLTKPFLIVRITCPSDSYDVNVEPAKDEVLFYDPTLVRSLFERLMEKIYGSLDGENAAKSSHRTPVKPGASSTSSFDILLARRPDATKQFQDEDPDQEARKPHDNHIDVSLPNGTSLDLIDKFRQNMSKDGGTDPIQARPRVPDGDCRTYVSTLR